MYDAVLTNVFWMVFMHPTNVLMVYVMVDEKFLFLRHSSFRTIYILFEDVKRFLYPVNNN